jgi:PAS domain S-box-containing protein
MHRLLTRQLQRQFGAGFQPPAEWAGFLDLVNKAYEQSDEDRLMLERSLELSSQELIEFHHAEKETILRRQIEEIEKERKHFKALADAVPAGVLRLDAREECNFVNQEWLKITGMSAAEAAGRGWWEAIHREDVAMFREHYDRLVGSGRAFACEHRVRTACGEDEVWVYCTAVAEHADEEGRGGYIFSMVDITERKKSLKHAERSQRLESIGVLAGGIAHDLNNALAPISLSVDLLSRSVSDADRRLLDVIALSTERGSDLVRNLVTFARGGAGAKDCMSIKRLVDELAVVVRASFPKNIEVCANVPEELPALLANFSQVHQVLLNLAVNARDAMQDGGRLTIDARVVRIETETKGNLRVLKEGDYLWVSVADTGCGMMPDVQDHIFEPFYSTKKTGTGFGLSNVAGIMKEHEGDVRVYSLPGQGTTFELYFPYQHGAVVCGAGELAVVEMDGRGRRVLVVDDEENIRSMLRYVLDKSNFETVEAADGLEGMMKVREMKDRLDWIITDMHMPELDGLELIRGARQVMPGIPIIVMTGRLEAGEREELEGARVERIIEKPFSRQMILAALRDGRIANC